MKTQKPHVEMTDRELIALARRGDKRASRELNERGQTSLLPEAAATWVTIEGHRVPLMRRESVEDVVAKYAPRMLRAGRQTEQRPGTVPLGGLRAQGFAIPDDPYQWTGQPRPLPKISPGPARAVPPTWPARDVDTYGIVGDDEVGRATYPGSPEPVRIDTRHPRRTKPVGADLTAGAQFVRNVNIFASHYGEGMRNPRDKIESWRGNYY